MTSKTKSTLISIAKMDSTCTETELNALIEALGMSAKTPKPQSRLLTIDETCDYLRVKRGTIWRWTQSGRLKPIHLSDSAKSIRFRTADLDAMITQA